MYVVCVNLASQTKLYQNLSWYLSSFVGPSKGGSCVFCRSFCSCSVACSIVLNVAVAFEQKLKLYVGLVMLHAVCCCRKLSPVGALKMVCRHILRPCRLSRRVWAWPGLGTRKYFVPATNPLNVRYTTSVTENSSDALVPFLSVLEIGGGGC